MKDLKDYILGNIFEAKKVDDPNDMSLTKISKEEFKVLLKKLLDEGGLDNISDGNMSMIASTIQMSTYKTDLYNWIYKSWYGDKYEESKQASIINEYDKRVAKDIVSVISRSSNFNNALKDYIIVKKKSPVLFDENSKDILSQLPNELGSFKTVFKNIINMKPPKNGIGVGPWEIFLQTFFSNINVPNVKANGKGDCRLNNLELEVKGSLGRISASKTYMGKEGYVCFGGMIDVLEAAGVDTTDLKKGQLFAKKTYKDHVKVFNKAGQDVAKSSLEEYFKLFTNKDKLDSWVDDKISFIVDNMFKNSSLDFNLVFNSLISTLNLFHYQDIEQFNSIIFINNNTSKFKLIKINTNTSKDEIFNIFNGGEFSFDKYVTEKHDPYASANYGPSVTYNG